MDGTNNYHKNTYENTYIYAQRIEDLKLHGSAATLYVIYCWGYTCILLELYVYIVETVREGSGDLCQRRTAGSERYVYGFNFSSAERTGGNTECVVKGADFPRVRHCSRR